MNKLNARKTIAVFGSATIAATLVACSNAASSGGAVTLDLAHVGDLQSPQQDIAELFSENLQAAGADIEVTIHDSGTLGSEDELQGAVLDGSVDMVIAGSFSHYAPWAGVLETPMLFTSNDEFRQFSEGEAGATLLSDLEAELGAVPLFIAPHEGPRYITTANTPVRTPEDMAGLKLRNPEVPSFTVMAEAVDAEPVSLDFSELYLALDRGVVDGQHNPLSHVVGQSFYEVQDYLTPVPWGISPHVVTMSESAWSELSEDQQSAVREAAEQTAADYFDLAEEQTQERLDQLSEEMTVVPADEVDVDAFVEVFENEGIPALEAEYGDKATDLVETIRSNR